jgi:excisionase family DNA binding protein
MIQTCPVKAAGRHDRVDGIVIEEFGHRIGGKVMKAQKDDALLTPAEVAALFRVDPKTVTRWAKAGKLSSIRTLGGHRRYRADEVKKFLEGVKGEV